MEMRLMTDSEKFHVRQTWALVEKGKLMETATKLFYDNLFEVNPTFRDQFPKDMSGQIKKLADTLAFAVKSLDWDSGDWERQAVDQQSDLFLILTAMGRRHKKVYHVYTGQYDPVGNSLLHALDLGLGSAFTPEVKAAWTKLYTLISSTMIIGSVMMTPEDLAEYDANTRNASLTPHIGGLQ